VEKARLDKILSNEEIRTIITALGTGVGDEFDLAKLRYNKLILMCDADVDGSHIRTLLLTLLYRQIPKLIEGGHIYIAQPPLYKIKRGAREEYIQTEEEMGRLLLDLGSEGLKLIRLKDKKQFSDSQFRDILGLLTELESFNKDLDKKGVNFRDFLGFSHPKTKKLPVYRAKVEGKYYFVYSDNELSKLTGKDEEADFIELFEAADIEKLIQRLDKIGLEASTYFYQEPKEPKKKRQEAAKLLYRLINNKEQQDLVCLRDVLFYVKTQANKGMNIQRYKGLGEMNPHQLWETTMDPAKRTILQITLEDTVEAEKTFTTLMGDQVQPRREFIENYAHAVRYLDI